jgi:hypothetical protein
MPTASWLDAFAKVYCGATNAHLLHPGWPGGASRGQSGKAKLFHLFKVLELLQT